MKLSIAMGFPGFHFQLRETSFSSHRSEVQKRSSTFCGQTLSPLVSLEINLSNHEQSLPVIGCRQRA